MKITNEMKRRLATLNAGRCHDYLREQAAQQLGSEVGAEVMARCEAAPEKTASTASLLRLHAHFSK